MKEDIEKIKDLKAVYSGAIEAGELSIANIIKGGIDLIEKLQKENEELKYKYDKALSDVIVGIDLDNTYIPVQKVKDKIKELEKEYKYLAEENKRVNKFEIELLQDLLEEKGE